jgi:hypothetical protein
LFIINDQTDAVTIEHNTAFNSAACTFSVAAPNTNFVFRNNLVQNDAAGGVNYGDSTINKFFPAGVWLKNVQPGADSSLYNAHRNNYFPVSLKAVGFLDLKGGNYRLAPTSRYKNAATDGRDIGCDFDLLGAAVGWSGERLAAN